MNISSKYKIPISFEVKNDFKSERSIDSKKFIFDVKDGFLDEVINSLLKNSNYRWNLQNETVYISPKSNGDEIISRFLDTKITITTTEINSERMNIESTIVATPEVKNKLKELSLTGIHYIDESEKIEAMILEELKQKGIANLYFPNTSVTQKKLDYSITFNNKSVREILNYIIVNTRINYWTIYRWGEKGEFITVVAI